MKEVSDFHQEELFRHQIYQRIVSLCYFELHCEKKLMTIEFNDQIRQKLHLPYEELDLTLPEFDSLILNDDLKIREEVIPVLERLPVNEEYRTPPYRVTFPESNQSVWIISVFMRISEGLLHGVHVDMSDI